MSVETRDLFTRAKLDASGMQEGAKAAKAALTSLNQSFAENKSEMKKLTSEMKAMEKEQTALSAKIKSNTATKEETERYRQLGTALTTAKTKMAQLSTEQQDLRSKISATNKELSSYYIHTEKSSKQTDSMKNSITGLASALKAVALGYTGKKLYEYLIGSNAEMEQYTTSFSVLLGSTEKAQEMIKNMTKFSAKTPLELTDVVKNGQLLMNYGVSADDVLGKMQQLGDLASGDAAKLERVATAYGQMLAKGKVSGEELQQMTEAGVPLLQALADTLGTTTAQVQDDISKSKVSISDLNAAITSMTTGDGQFAGMMEQQSQTMNGMLSTLKDNIEQFGRDVGDGAFKEVKATLQDIMDKLTEAQENGTVQEIAEDVGKALSGVVKTLTFLLKAGYECKELVIATLVVIAAYKTALGGIEIAHNLVRIKTELSKASQIAYNAALSANPIMLVVIALSALAAGFAVAALSQNNNYKALQEMNDAWKSAKESAENSKTESEKEIAVIARKAEIYDELRKKVSLTAAEQKQLQSAATDLKNVLGDGVNVIDEKTGKYKDLNSEVSEYIKNVRTQTETEILKDRYKDALANKDKLEKEIASLESELNVGWNPLGPFSGIQEKIEAMHNALMMKKEYEDVIKEYQTLLSENFTGSEENPEDPLKKQEESVTALSDAFSSAESAAKLYKSAVDEVDESGRLSLDTLKDLVKQYPQMEGVIAEYISGLKSEKDVIASLSDCYKTDYDNYYNTIVAKLQSSESFYSGVISGNAEAVNKFKSQYGIDLANYANYMDAKNAILNGKSVKTENDLTSAQKKRAISEYGSVSAYLSHLNGWSTVAKQRAAADFESLFSDSFSSSSVKYQKLVNDYSSSSGSGSGNKVLSQYEIANAAYKSLVEERIELIDREKEAKKEAYDQAIEEINSEIEARKRMNEDDSTQKEIESLQAQLKYMQLDDFSRMELQKRLEAMQKDQAETAWQRQKEAEKDALKAGYDTSTASLAALEQQLRNNLAYANTILSDLKSGSKSATSIVNNNSKSANVNIVNNALTAGQIAQKIISELMDGVI